MTTGNYYKKGSFHPLTLTMNEAVSIFKDMGFTVEQGPELEDEWHNFDALNVPKDHPARDMQDTFFIKDREELVLRTHTSNTQIRYMENLAKDKKNPPFAIIVPATLPSLFQSPDDYYQRWIYGSILRILRIISLFLSVLLPSLYVATTSFHTSIIPTRLAYFIASSREGVPFPAFVEAIIMEISLALLMESVVRLPKAIGATIGIVGGLIIGQAAVSAGIVSPIMIIIVSLTAITSFTTPNYEMNSAFRIVRFILIILASIMGLYGIVIGLIVLLVHMIKLKSFGLGYLLPIVNSSKSDFKDLYVRFPLKYFKRRPHYLDTKDKVRQK